MAPPPRSCCRGDAVRDVGLPELGVKLDDRDGGALWKLYDADELKKEIAREREAKEEKERAKRLAKEEAARKAAEKEAKAKVPPSDMFKTFSEYEGLYSKYDDEGVPTHDAAGEPLAKSAVKKLARARRSNKRRTRRTSPGRASKTSPCSNALIFSITM